MSHTMDQYNNAMKARRRGLMSELGPEAKFLDVKPDYYADSRILSEDALREFENFKKTHPPYGLVDGRGNSFVPDPKREPWYGLSMALRASGHAAFDLATPRITSCPYHDVLAKKLGGTAIPLRPIDYDQHGLDTLRSVATPGAELNAPLFVSLIRRLPDIQRLHGSNLDAESFARNSVSLLREPLAHPQQWAAGFVYSLGALGELLGPKFLNDKLALKYTKVESASDGSERLAWAIPTQDFTLRNDLVVRNRLLGTELGEPDPVASMHYPVGTRLGDIKVDEPTIGCPGNQLAVAMWDRTIDVIVGEQLWQRAAHSRL